MSTETIFKPIDKTSGNEQEKSNLQFQLNNLQNLLSQEREKNLTTNLELKQKEAISMEVENSIKQARERLNREVRNREIDEERKKLKQRLGKLEDKLAQERQIWMQIMQTHIKNTPKQTTPQNAALHANPDTAVGNGKYEIPRQKKEYSEKDELSAELLSIKNTLSSLENRDIYLGKLSSVIANLKQTINSIDADKLQTQTHGIDLMKQKISHIENKVSHQDCQSSITVQKILHSKMRAISELLATKKDLNTLRAVNVALEREYEAVNDKNKKMAGELERQSAHIKALKTSLSSLRQDYTNEISALNKLCNEKNITVNTLKKQLAEASQNYQVKKLELENLIRKQSRAYIDKLNQLMQDKYDTEQKLMHLQRHNCAASAQSEFLSDKLNREISQKQELITQKNILLADKKILYNEIRRLKDEKKRIEDSVLILTKQSELLLKQKERFDVMLTTASINPNALKHPLEKPKNSFFRDPDAEMKRMLTFEAEIAKQKAVLKLHQEKTVKQYHLSNLYKTLLKMEIKKKEILEKNLKNEHEINTKLQNIFKKEEFHKAELKTKLDKFQKVSKGLSTRIKWALTAKLPK